MTAKLHTSSRGDWEKLIRWLALPATTKAVAYALATFADNKSGENVRPGERLLAQSTGLSTRAVREHIGNLMAEGLIFQRSNGKFNGAARMGQCLRPLLVGAERPAGRAGGGGLEHRNEDQVILTQNTGTSRRSPEADDRNTGSSVRTSLMHLSSTPPMDIVRASARREGVKRVALGALLPTRSPRPAGTLPPRHLLPTLPADVTWTPARAGHPREHGYSRCTSRS